MAAACLRVRGGGGGGGAVSGGGGGLRQSLTVNTDG